MSMKTKTEPPAESERRQGSNLKLLRSICYSIVPIKHIRQSQTLEEMLAWKDVRCSEDDAELGVVKFDVFRPPNDPFELPHLLDAILQYLQLDDWKNSRLVCSMWRSACNRQMKKYRLNIADISRLLSLVTHTDQWDYNTHAGTYSNIALPIGVSINNFYLSHFLEDYGHRIKSLVIPTAGWTVENLRSILFVKCTELEELALVGDIPTDQDARILDGLDPSTTLPKMKTLILHLTNAQETAPTHPIGFIMPSANIWAKRLISDLLSVLPNLEAVRCSNKRYLAENPLMCSTLAKQVSRPIEDVDTSFTRVNQFLTQKLFSRTHDSNLKLVELGLYLHVNFRGMQKLEVKKYPLRTLDLHARIEDKCSLISLLTSLGNTLKYLRIRMDLRLGLDVKCSFLKELETLYLEDYGGSLGFLGDIPKLKSLILSKFECRKFTRQGIIPCFPDSKVKSLTIEDLREPDKQPKCLKRIATILPNITELNLNKVTDNDLLRIFDGMLKLEHLNLVSQSVSNVGLSGFIDSDVDQILDKGYELERSQDYEKLRRLPYIGDLKSLKSLSLRGDLKGLSPPCMTGRMVCHRHGLWVLNGICNLRHLRTLIVHNATLSSLELKRLMKSMNLIKLELVDCMTDIMVEQWIHKTTFGKPFQLVLKTNA